MQYQGGKARIARHIAPYLTARAAPGVTYWEPFLGGASVAAEVAPAFNAARLSDAHEDLIIMWRAVVDGWEPPATITEEEWGALRNAPPSPLRGFAGFAASWGGRWFQGYARPHPKQRDKVGSNRAACIRKARSLRGAVIEARPYTAIAPRRGDVVYLDPPYANSKPYPGLPAFDSAAMWETAAKWAAAGVHVFVSEFSAPEPWIPVWSKEHTNQYRRAESRTDHLFTYPEVSHV